MAFPRIAKQSCGNRMTRTEGARHASLIAEVEAPGLRETGAAKPDLWSKTMSDYVVAPAPRAAAPVEGGGLFPPRRIFCVGQNYAAHAREMGGDPTREPPFFFTKPADALVTGGADAPYPSRDENLHHEIELVVAISSGGATIPVAEAQNHIYGYAVGLDLTRRDLQAKAKEARRPGT